MITPNSVISNATAARSSHWSAPPSSFSKFNVDATVGRGGMFGAVGAISRDHLVVFLSASTIFFTKIDDSTTLEALAAREALALAEDLNLQHIHITSDCKAVVDDIKKGGAATYGPIILEI